MANNFNNDENKKLSSGNFRYLIINPKNGGIRDLARFLIKKDKDSSAKFLESSDDGVIEEELLGGKADDYDDDDGETTDHRWVIFVSILVRKIIAIFGKPMEWTGYLVEFFLNFLSANGKFFGLIYNILHGKVLNFLSKIAVFFAVYLQVKNFGFSFSKDYAGFCIC